MAQSESEFAVRSKLKFLILITSLFADYQPGLNRLLTVINLAFKLRAENV
jgi:hypothetical protein